MEFEKLCAHNQAYSAVHVCKKCIIGVVERLISILHRQAKLEFCRKQGENGVVSRVPKEEREGKETGAVAHI